VHQLLAHGRWFSPGTPASSTTRTGLHDITEIFLKMALSTKIKSNQINVLLHMRFAEKLWLSSVGDFIYLYMTVNIKIIALCFKMYFPYYFLLKRNYGLTQRVPLVGQKLLTLQEYHEFTSGL
jgi:hypothetical protein